MYEKENQMAIANCVSVNDIVETEREREKNAPRRQNMCYLIRFAFFFVRLLLPCCVYHTVRSYGMPTD